MPPISSGQLPAASWAWRVPKSFPVVQLHASLVRTRLRPNNDVRKEENSRGKAVRWRASDSCTVGFRAVLYGRPHTMCARVQLCTRLPGRERVPTDETTTTNRISNGRRNVVHCYTRGCDVWHRRRFLRALNKPIPLSLRLAYSCHSLIISQPFCNTNLRNVSQSELREKFYLVLNVLNSRCERLIGYWFKNLKTGYI